MRARNLKNAARKYFLLCDGEKRPYTLAGLAFALRTTRAELLASDEPVIVAAMARCEAYAEERLYDRDRARGAEFILKNDHGWTERPQTPEDNKIELSLSPELEGWSK